MDKIAHLLILFYLFGFNKILNSIDQYYYTAANDRHLLINLIGSIHATYFENTNEIAVYNLDLEPIQINYLNSIQKVKVYNIKKLIQNY